MRSRLIMFAPNDGAKFMSPRFHRGKRVDTRVYPYVGAYPCVRPVFANVGQQERPKGEYAPDILTIALLRALRIGNRDKFSQIVL